MKKIFLLSCLLLLTLVSHAQHLKFMGIPINGNIDVFQTKLAQKGVKISNLSKTAPVGVRIFEGYFTNEKADIIVFYNIKTKNVYHCRVAFDKVFETIDKAQSYFDYYKEKLNEKYVGLTSDMIDETKSDSHYSIMVIQPPVREGSTVLGFIELNIKEFDYQYSLWIDYIDIQNNEKNEKQSTNDL